MEVQQKMSSTAPTGLSARRLTTGYGDREILHSVDLDVPESEFTVIVGPNACGKSTLLKTLARGLKPISGSISLDGEPLEKYRPKQLAKRLGMLPQSPVAPEGITVAELVGRGRYPHQALLRQWSTDDEEAIERAMRQAGVQALADRAVAELSGGQRQRVWIAMALAQETPTLLLDEPTTFLDISHQIEVLELARSLHAEGRTVVAVLHELNLAFRYATNLVVMHDGNIVAHGVPTEVVTADLIERVYDLPCLILEDPVAGTPMVIPLAGADRHSESAQQISAMNQRSESALTQTMMKSE